MNQADAAGSSTEASYFTRIEEHFARHRGTPLVLSPADWHLVASWQQQSIPLDVVLRAVDEVMENAAARGRSRPILSLSYCRHQVEKNFKEYLEAIAGSHEAGAGGKQQPLWQRLEERAARLREMADHWPKDARPAAQDALQVLRDSVQALRSGARQAAELEDNLMTLEGELLDRLESSLPADEAAALMNDCVQRLEPFRRRMSSEVFQSTLLHARRTAVRRRYRLPRLSLLAD